jgi:8-oxo-dGTP diphosphatase
MKIIEVVAAVIFRGGKALCVQRSENAREYVSLKWEFPGGKVELYENREQALKREIREELDVEVGNLDYFMTVEHTYPDFHLVMHVYTCSILKGEPLLKEHIALKWLPVEELDQLDWAAADIPIVEKLMSERG